MIRLKNKFNDKDNNAFILVIWIKSLIKWKLLPFHVKKTIVILQTFWKTVLYEYDSLKIIKLW